MNAVESANGHQVTLEELMARSEKERGYPIPVLETELLLKRVKDGGQSGDFLSKSFLSAYDMSPFNMSLGDFINLDAEGMRLFHQILHIRHVDDWSDIEYTGICILIEDILSEAA